MNKQAAAAEGGADKYAALNKNTVDAKDQLKDSSYLRFHHRKGTGPRILFVGNSITLHGISHEIGWHNAWGMAASAEERDYVHLLEREILQKNPEAVFCICQVSGWERQYKNGEETFPTYEGARDFGADVIVVRCIENCPKTDFDSDIFQRELHKLLQYLDKEQKAKILITTGFWHHPGDDALRAYAASHGLPCIELGDLGDDDAMKAIGLFEHHGVANHPGDLGMEAIARRIGNEILPWIPESN